MNTALKYSGNYRLNKSTNILPVAETGDTANQLHLLKHNLKITN